VNNSNRGFFRTQYPQRWLNNQQARERNCWHQMYQQITLDRLDAGAGNWVLECGSGSGEILQRLHAAVPTVKTVGVDLGRESLIWGQEQRLKGLDSDLVEGDIGVLPFSDAEFDRVLTSSVLWYLPDAKPAIREMIRVLKPGGRFVFDVRSPFHINNVLTTLTLSARRWSGRSQVRYSFFSPGGLARFLRTQPVTFDIEGYFVLLPTRLPLINECGNLARFSPWLSFEAGQGLGRWLALKLLISGEKVAE